jgi:hypothetical protein
LLDPLVHAYVSFGFQNFLQGRDSNDGVADICPLPLWLGGYRQGCPLGLRSGGSRCRFQIDRAGEGSVCDIVSTEL